MSHPSGSVNERILRHNEELTNFVARSSEEKNELRNALSRLEEEIWQFRQKDARYQVRSCPEIIKLLSCSTQLSMILRLLIYILK